MAAGRRGRPYHVPHDSTAINGLTVDVEARVGWLLLMSRLHHRDPDLALGGSFNEALRKVGLQTDRSAVSRWESGKVTPRYFVLVAYEQALGLRAGQLTAVVNAQRRAFGSGAGQAAWMPILDSGSDGFQQRLDALFDGLLDGPGTGPEWTALAHHAAAASSMYVNGRVWLELSARLVNQMARSVGVAYLQRFEAVRLLLEHRAAHQWVLRATGDFLDDPAVQVINDPMNILEISDDPQAAQLVLDKLHTTRSDDVLGAAASAVGRKIETDCYTSDQLDGIEFSVAQRLQRDDLWTGTLQALIMAMPEPARSRMLVSIQGRAGHEEVVHSAAHGERFSPEQARMVSQSIADELRFRMPGSQLHGEDTMAPRLIREALFSARGGRSHAASLALLGSPFRSQLAICLAEEITRVGLDDPLAVPFARLLRYVAGPQQEEQLIAWLPMASPPVARDFALAIGHVLSDRPLSELLGLVRGDGSSTDRALLYGLGMRQATALQQLAADDEQPAAIREAASWWMRQGGAVRV